MTDEPTKPATEAEVVEAMREKLRNIAHKNPSLGRAAVAHRALEAEQMLGVLAARLKVAEEAAALRRDVANRDETIREMVSGIEAGDDEVATLAALGLAVVPAGQGWQAGWAAGREAGAQCGEAWPFRHPSAVRGRVNTDEVEAAEKIVDAIRALPVPPAPARDGEAG